MKTQAAPKPELRAEIHMIWLGIVTALFGIMVITMLLDRLYIADSPTLLNNLLLAISTAVLTTLLALLTYHVLASVRAKRVANAALEQLRERLGEGPTGLRSAPRESTSRRPATWSEKMAEQRGTAVLTGMALLAVAIGAHAFLTGRLDGSMLLIAATGAGIVLLDLALMRLRVATGVYGSNRTEAEELLAFLAQRSGNDGGPPRRAIRDPLDALETEPARPEGAVAGEGH